MKIEGSFSQKIVEWQKIFGRHTLPWQKTKDPYVIWLSEIMLQQTRVETVVPYFGRFLRSIPSLHRLAQSSQDQVLALWSGLGYYRRAINLHKSAILIRKNFSGHFPKNYEDIITLPGVGETTANAISVFAFGQRRAILDGNVKRVLARVFNISGELRSSKTTKEMWRLSKSLVPKQNIETYTQGLMDLGSEICVPRNPNCDECPVRNKCLAFKNDLVHMRPILRAKVNKLPIRKTTMLILVSTRQVCLKRRPENGIWGGLYSFPEIKITEKMVDSFCKRVIGVDLKKIQKLPLLRHKFSHFELLISPLLCEVDRDKDNDHSSNYEWVGFDQVLSWPIPKPIRLLVSDIVERY